LQYEYILLDLGPPAPLSTRSIFFSLWKRIFDYQPEPTSIENVYRLMPRYLLSPDSPLFFRDRLQGTGKKRPAAIRG